MMRHFGTLIIMVDESEKVLRTFLKHDGPRYVDWPDWFDGDYQFVEGGWERCLFQRVEKRP